MLNPHLQRTTSGRLGTGLLAGALLALLVPVAVIRGAIAQAPLEGVVYDSSGAVVPDVKLTLVGEKAKDKAFDRTAAIYKLAGAEDKFKRE